MAAVLVCHCNSVVMNVWLCCHWDKPVIISLSNVNNKAYLSFLQFIKVICASWGKNPKHYRELWKGTITLKFFILDFGCIQVHKWHLFLPLVSPLPSFLSGSCPRPPLSALCGWALGPGCSSACGRFALCIFLTQGKGRGVWPDWSPGALQFCGFAAPLGCRLLPVLVRLHSVLRLLCGGPSCAQVLCSSLLSVSQGEIQTT